MTTSAAPYTPEVTARSSVALAELTERLERATQSMEALTSVAHRLLPMSAMAVDTMDEMVSRGRDRGIDVDARLHRLVALLERLTTPASLQALDTLVDRLPALERAALLAEQLPGMVAIGVDTADAIMRNAQAAGLDPEQGVRLAGRLGTAFIRASSAPAPAVGLLGMFRALREPETQRALGLALRVAAEVGRSHDHQATGRT
jgi:uncharacterized protein YjgD (DUF1641 family)